MKERISKKESIKNGPSPYVLCTAVFIPVTGLSASDPFSGSWKLNLAKSKLDPDHNPASATMRFEPTARGRQQVNELLHELLAHEVETDIEQSLAPLEPRIIFDLDARDCPPDVGTLACLKISGGSDRSRD
jgi:hypothetical protein